MQQIVTKGAIPSPLTEAGLQEKTRGGLINQELIQDNDPTTFQCAWPVLRFSNNTSKRHLINLMVDTRP